MESIVLLSGNHLCHNPRVVKEATALSAAGFQVLVLGAWVDIDLKARDLSMLKMLPFQFQPVVDLTGDSTQAQVKRLSFRLRNKLGSQFYCQAGVANPWQFGHAQKALLNVVRNHRADLFISHSEVGMLVGESLMRHGAHVGIDLEDWFSEDLLPEVRLQRPVALLQKLERTLLRQGVHATCTSQSMSHAVANEFECATPAVVYNAFPWSDRESIRVEQQDRQNANLPSVHWYSQTIGHGRGLKDLFEALPYLRQSIEVHLRGQPVAGFAAWLEDKIPPGWHDRVFVHPIVPNEDLLSRIAEHDIGFAGEMVYCRSRDLTVTNKILHYLLGGLAVVASDTTGQQEVATMARTAAGADAVMLYPSGDPQALAQQINLLLESRERLAHAKAAALLSAERAFCWERQVPHLVESVQASLVRKNGRR